MTPNQKAQAAPSTRVLVWDLPVRVFHWLMVLCFAGAYLSSENERWKPYTPRSATPWPD